MENNRIFLGLNNIASQLCDLKTSFKKLGYKTFLVSQTPKNNLVQDCNDINVLNIKNRVGYFYPKKISVRIKKYYDSIIDNYVFKKAISNCDIFIFMWSTFRKDNSDLEILKALNKKIVVFLVGDDIRWKPAMEKDFKLQNCNPYEYSDYNYSFSNLDSKLRYLRNVEKYADIIYSNPLSNQLSLRPYYHFWYPINLEFIKENLTQRKVPKIIHSPSDYVIKGTKYILLAIEKLKSDGLDFDFELIQNMPNKDILKKYTESDILIGQMFSTYGGKQERECLAAGCVVVSSFKVDYFYNNNFSKGINDCPIVDVSPNNLYNKLKDLIKNQTKRKLIASQGRSYINKYHNSDFLSKEIIENLNTKPICDYHPSFYKKKYFPESDPKYLNVYNKWNKYVMDCDWYKETVKSDERNGLVF